MAKAKKQGKRVSGLTADTKTAAGHLATGYRNRKGRFGGKPKPPGAVKVKQVEGGKWAVFDYS
ncbi:MAG: hypothetical protein R6U93_00870 [Dehalococcoidia bacterium]